MTEGTKSYCEICKHTLAYDCEAKIDSPECIKMFEIASKSELIDLYDKYRKGDSEDQCKLDLIRSTLMVEYSVDMFQLNIHLKNREICSNCKNKCDPMTNMILGGNVICQDISTDRVWYVAYRTNIDGSIILSKQKPSKTLPKGYAIVRDCKYKYGFITPSSVKNEDGNVTGIGYFIVPETCRHVQDITTCNMMAVDINDQIITSGTYPEIIPNLHMELFSLDTLTVLTNVGISIYPTPNQNSDIVYGETDKVDVTIGVLESNKINELLWSKINAKVIRYILDTPNVILDDLFQVSKYFDKHNTYYKVYADCTYTVSDKEEYILKIPGNNDSLIYKCMENLKKYHIHFGKPVVGRMLYDILSVPGIENQLGTPDKLIEAIEKYDLLPIYIAECLINWD